MVGTHANLGYLLFTIKPSHHHTIELKVSLMVGIYTNLGYLLLNH